MALEKVTFLTDGSKGQYTFAIPFSGGTMGTLNGSTEFGFVAPWDGELDDNPLILSVGTNTTHSDGEITATLEKNGDGGTSMLATAPSILNDAGTGARNSAATATGITKSAPSATLANKRFSKGDMLFVTLSESGSGGTDPSDVAFVILAHRLGDVDVDQTVNISS